jgi:hypothetical protein
VSSLYSRFCLPSLARPEHGINAEIAHFVNEHNKVMTKNFADSVSWSQLKDSLPKPKCLVSLLSRDSFCVALRMNRFAVFIGGQVHLKHDWSVAEWAENFWRRVLHKHLSKFLLISNASSR